ncbi:MAG: VCBS repeat-containing protein [Pedosphaera sp.]|nr:VCBS repeat-containing protein [Pedosphaera sp.]
MISPTPSSFVNVLEGGFRGLEFRLQTVGGQNENVWALPPLGVGAPANRQGSDLPHRQKESRRCLGTLLSRGRGFLAAGISLALMVTTPRSAAADSSQPFYQSAGTRAMARRLEELALAIDPSKSHFFSIERAAKAGSAINQVQDSKELLNALLRYALELLNPGRTEEAIAVYARTDRLMGEQRVRPTLVGRVQLRTLQAVAFLRQGEQDNCITNHTIDSCLLPIQGRGVHRNQRGSRAAIQILTNTLQDAPEDLSLRWLLNIAYMTVGEYPQKVPAHWLIPPKTFESEYDIKRFVDVAGVAGLDVNELSGGSLMEDFDGDGLLNILVTSFGCRDPMHYFHNEGDGTFRERTREAGLLGETGGLNMVHADYNNDGYPDVFVLRGAWQGTQGRQPNSLLRNNGNGTFDDVTEEAGMLRFHPTQTAVWFDYNLDGWIDLFVGNETAFGEVAPCELYRNNRDGTFTECAASVGLNLTTFVKGAVGGDFNNDRRPDLFISVHDQSNLLFRNDGPKETNAGVNGGWVFTEVGHHTGVTEPRFSFPCWFWDYDNDGWEDLFVACYSINKVGDVAADYLGLPHTGERARLYRNRGNGTFADVTQEVGLFKVIHATGANFGDLDNDGWLDFYAGTGDPSLMRVIPNRMFRNADAKRFQEVTTWGDLETSRKATAFRLVILTTMVIRMSTKTWAAPIPAMSIETASISILDTAIIG